MRKGPKSLLLLVRCEMVSFAGARVALAVGSALAAVLCCHSHLRSLKEAVHINVHVIRVRFRKRVLPKQMSSTDIDIQIEHCEHICTRIFGQT